MQTQLLMNRSFNHITANQWFLIKLILLTAAVLLCGSLDVPAQNKMTAKKSNTKTPAVESLTKKEPLQEPVQILTNTTPSVRVINTSESDFLSGEASVAVNPKQPTVIRLGLSQNAVSIVEFPMSDGVYYIHEGNPKLVSVFQSPTKESDRSITIYPGEGFVVGQQNASAAITLQMRSGLILILEFVPVPDIRKNAHRCVIAYDREEVISARRAAGLAYNLGEEIKTPAKKSTKASSKLVSLDSEEATVNEEVKTETPEILPVNLIRREVTGGTIIRQENDGTWQKPKTELELSRLVNRRLADCLKNPSKVLKDWSETKNGLSLAVSLVTEIDSNQRLVVAAVRNTSMSNLRLVSGTPELQVLTVDEKGNPLLTEKLERRYVETTSFEGLILPGSTVYYAIVYNAPVMGVSQRLSLLVSHREAADSPSTALLPNSNKAAK